MVPKNTSSRFLYRQGPGFLEPETDAVFYVFVKNYLLNLSENAVSYHDYRIYKNHWPLSFPAEFTWNISLKTFISDGESVCILRYTIFNNWKVDSTSK